MPFSFGLVPIGALLLRKFELRFVITPAGLIYVPRRGEQGYAIKEAMAHDWRARARQELDTADSLSSMTGLIGHLLLSSLAAYLLFVLSLHPLWLLAGTGAYGELKFAAILVLLVAILVVLFSDHIRTLWRWRALNLFIASALEGMPVMSAEQVARSVTANPWRAPAITALTLGFSGLSGAWIMSLYYGDAVTPVLWVKLLLIQWGAGALSVLGIAFLLVRTTGTQPKEW